MEAIAPSKFNFEHLDAGFELFQRTGVALPEDSVKHLKSNCHGALFGAVRCVDLFFQPSLEHTTQTFNIRHKQLPFSQGSRIFFSNCCLKKEIGIIR